MHKFFTLSPIILATFILISCGQADQYNKPAPQTKSANNTQKNTTDSQTPPSKKINNPKEIEKKIIPAFTEKFDLKKTATSLMQAYQLDQPSASRVANAYANAKTNPNHLLNAITSPTIKQAIIGFISKDKNADFKLNKNEYQKYMQYAIDKIQSPQISKLKSIPIKALAGKVNSLVFDIIDADKDQALTFTEFKQMFTNTSAIKKQLTQKIQKTLKGKINIQDRLHRFINK